MFFYEMVQHRGGGDSFFGKGHCKTTCVVPYTTRVAQPNHRDHSAMVTKSHHPRLDLFMK